MTEKPQLYLVGDTGPVIETNNDLDALALDADAQADRMSFGPYSMSASGLRFDEDLISGSFKILGRARDPDGQDWARWIQFKDADGRQHQVAIRDGDLHGDPRTLAATLARQGLWISPRHKHRAQLVEYLNSIEVDERVTFVPRTGWHTVGAGRVFVLPDQSFGGTNELVLLNTDGASPYGSRGSLTDWQNSTGRLTAGQRLAVLAVSTALSGPLLNLSGQDGGGIHFLGISSSGKTSLNRAAASVWGPRAYMRSWRATANGLEGAAVLANDTLLVLDELGVIDSRELNAAVYQLAIGHGKGRARRDGSMRTPASWRVMVVSSGEVSIASKVEEDKNRRAKAGQEVRILDIPADAGKGYGAFDSPRPGENSAAGLADEIVVSAEEFYGTAGPAFVEAIVKCGIDKTIEYLNASINAFCACAVKFGNEGQIRRAVRRLALIAAAGELAHEFGIVPHWKKGEATAAAVFALNQWIARRGGGEAAEEIAAVRSVRLFIEKYGDARFSDVDLPDGKIPNRAGWRKGNGEDELWLVLPEVFKAEVCAGQDPTLVAKVLADRGMLLRDERHYQRTHRIQGKVLRLYTITTAILSGSSDAETVVTAVTAVTPNEIKGFSHSGSETVTTEKSNKNKPVTTVTAVTTHLHTDTPRKDSEPDPDDWSFNKEDEEEDLGIPDFLQRVQS
jgi:putative DNA primase/helicase